MITMLMQKKILRLVSSRRLIKGKSSCSEYTVAAAGSNKTAAPSSTSRAKRISRKASVSLCLSARHSSFSCSCQLCSPFCQYATSPVCSDKSKSACLRRQRQRKAHSTGSNSSSTLILLPYFIIRTSSNTM